MSLLNTDMGRELDHMAEFLKISEIMQEVKGLKELFLSSQNPKNQLNINMILTPQLQ